MKLLPALALSLLAAAPAAASPDPAPGAPRAADDCARARKAGRPCVLTFDRGDTVEGRIVGPEGDDVQGGPATPFGTLIRYRANFVPEILRSVDAL